MKWKNSVLIISPPRNVSFRNWPKCDAMAKIVGSFCIDFFRSSNRTHSRISSEMIRFHSRTLHILYSWIFSVARRVSPWRCRNRFVDGKLLQQQMLDAHFYFLFWFLTVCCSTISPTADKDKPFRIESDKQFSAVVVGWTRKTFCYFVQPWHNFPFGWTAFLSFLFTIFGGFVRRSAIDLTKTRIRTMAKAIGSVTGYLCNGESCSGKEWKGFNDEKEKMRANDVYLVIQIELKHFRLARKPSTRIPPFNGK